MYPAKLKLFVAILLGPTIVVGLAALSLNLIVDPLWMLPQVGERPWLHYCVADERTNKINRLIYGHLVVDSVLFGSSRSAPFDTRFFRNSHVYNMAVNGLRPNELPEHLRIFRERIGVPKDVYIGFDFYGYLAEPGDEAFVTRARQKEALSDAASYRIKNFFDFSVLEIHFKRSSASIGVTTVPTHDYNGIRYFPRGLSIDQTISEQMRFFEKDIYGAQKPDPRYRAKIAATKAISPTSAFYPYVPPVRVDLFRLISKTGHLTDYINWIRGLVETFGAVRQFSGINSFTNDKSNFYDLHHVYADKTKIMIDIMEGRVQPGDDGFGLLITKDNFDQYASQLRRDIGN